MFKPRTVGLLSTVALFALGTIAVAQDKKPTAETKPASKPAIAKTADPKAGEKPADKTAAGQPSPEEMAKFMQLSMPSEGHAKLKPLAGKWNFITKWQMTPNAPWDESTGKTEFKWIMGGRFLVQDLKSDPSPSMGGMIFEGHGMMGYDNISKKYWNTWLDTMGTGIMFTEGTADGSGKTFTSTGKYNCPMVGGEKTAKTVLKIEGDDKAVFQMFDKTPDGTEFASLEVTYTRVK